MSLTNYICDIHNNIYNLNVVDNTIYFPSQITAVTAVVEDGVTLTENVDYWIDFGGSSTTDGGTLVRNGRWTRNRRNADGSEGLKLSLVFGYTTYPDDLKQCTIDLAKFHSKKNVVSTLSSEGVESQIMGDELPVTVKKFIQSATRIRV